MACRADEQTLQLRLLEAAFEGRWATALTLMSMLQPVDHDWHYPRVRARWCCSGEFEAR